MDDRVKFSTPSLKNEKGQVAIFVALIFQVLFLFFAMIINVGLLVHHKINLQNSVDLAAYYGAMKQAENMNAVAHVNYQIRQSWKLLSWRYRVIGSAGEASTNGEAQPFLKDTGQVKDADSDKINSGQKDFYEAPSFCITYAPFKPMPENENTCKQMADFSGVKLFKPPAIIAGFLAFSYSIRTTSELMLEAAIERCKIMGAWNYVMLGKFVVAYNLDQAGRMTLINKIARATSASTTDFYDIDGDSVNEGIKKTLNKNLTYANKESLGTFKVYNSLGADGCNSTGVSESRPPKWLSAINIVPAFNYIDTECDPDKIGVKGAPLVGGGEVSKAGPKYFVEEGKFAGEINSLSKYIGPRDDPDNINNFTLGVEKNPWCMAYVGVQATTKPAIPFSPFGSVELKAQAFAKPFGGRIGPWFYNKWMPGVASRESAGGGRGEQVDKLLPKRTNDPGAGGSQKERIVNFSRFPGDEFGLMSRMVIGNGAAAIYKMDPKWATGGSGSKSKTSPNYADWDHLPFNFTGAGKSGDILAWSGSDDTPMRELEMAAVAPDAFDYTYYSIDPDYYNNYYLRLKNGLLAKRGATDIRTDIGSRNGNSFSVRDQVKFVREKQGDGPLKNYRLGDLQTYISFDWKNALTGWSEKSLMDYSLDPSRFGRCLFPAGIDGPLVPPSSGNCAGGGTTGYSVKLVATDYLKKTDLRLGGASGGTGPLNNPPPADW